MGVYLNRAVTGVAKKTIVITRDKGGTLNTGEKSTIRIITNQGCCRERRVERVHYFHMDRRYRGLIDCNYGRGKNIMQHTIGLGFQ